MPHSPVVHRPYWWCAHIVGMCAISQSIKSHRRSYVYGQQVHGHTTLGPSSHYESAWSLIRVSHSTSNLLIKPLSDIMWSHSDSFHSNRQLMRTWNLGYFGYAHCALWLASLDTISNRCRLISISSGAGTHQAQLFRVAHRKSERAWYQKNNHCSLPGLQQPNEIVTTLLITRKHG